jgi:nicotinate-nucleotide adenylyltransferase
MTAAPGRIGILGGTFDPVHAGHVAAAEAAGEALSLDRVLLIPSHLPPHRPGQPRASASHRFAMVGLAVGGHPRLEASDAELRQPGPSFTADTLRRLQGEGFDASQLFFIIGTDAFADIASWRDYPALLDLAHFVVVSRARQSFGVLYDRLTDLVPRMRAADGRAGLRDEGRGCSVFLVNADTPDISSTDVRNRAARGQSLAGLVTADVERYIRTHGLYGSPPSSPGNGLA